MVNKSTAFISAAIALMMISFVIAETFDQTSAEENAKKVAEKQGIPESDITNVTEVDFNDLPKEVSVKDIADSNVGLFKVETKTGKPSFVITFSNQGFQRISQPYFATSFLGFGIDEEKNTSSFMKMSSGVKGSLEKGYVMTRSGSIVGLSTNLEVTESMDSGSIQVIMYKNGERVGLGNLVDSSSTGIKSDYDIQSRGIVTFNPGDVFSVYLDNPEGAGFKEVTTIMEMSVPGN